MVKRYRVMRLRVYLYIIFRASVSEGEKLELRPKE